MEKRKPPQPPWLSRRCTQNPVDKDDELLYTAIENMDKKGQSVDRKLPEKCHLPIKRRRKRTGRRITYQSLKHCKYQSEYYIKPYTPYVTTCL